MRYLHFAEGHGFETFLAFLLFVEMLEFPFVVAAIEAGRDVLAVRTERLTRQHFAPDTCLNLNLKLLARNGLFEPLHKRAADQAGLRSMEDQFQRIHRRASDKEGHLDQIRCDIVRVFVVKRSEATTA